VAWGLAGALALTTVLLAAGYWRQSHREGTLFQLSVLPPAQGFTSHPANISPDGRMLVSNARLEGREMLWIRRLDSLEGQPISGTENGRNPFWSADSRSIGFFAGTKLKRVEIAGGAAQTVCDAPRGMGGTWNREGVIVFAPDPLSRLYRVPSTGGTPEPVTELDTTHRESAHRWPRFLPDGKRFLYAAQSRRREDNAIYVGELGSRERIRLVSTQGNGAWARLPAGGSFGSEMGCLLFYREGSLLGQRVDTGRFQVVGEPFPIAGPVGYGPSNKHADFSVSDNGVLAYSHQAGAGEQLVWRDRAGKQLGTIDKPGSLYTQPLLYIRPAVSPDGNTLAAGVLDPDAGSYSVWLIDLKTGTPSRFTFEASRWPVWSPDGKQIAFNLDRTGNDDLYVKAVSGAAGERLLLSNPFRKVPSDWSGDGNLLLFDQEDPKTKRDVWALPLSGGKPYPILQTAANEYAARFSPDGRWIAYTSDESGQEEVYVQSFPPARKRKISHQGGSYPEWRRDGKELFYVSADGQVMAASLADEAAFTFAVAKPLFPATRGFLTGYSVAGDGQRFLMNMLVERKQSEPVTVVINWTEGIR
jgi:Tol biopolymer transport system component